MPKATQPTAPTCGVCESEPTLSSPGQGVAFSDHGMTDALGALAIFQLAVQADALLFGKVFLLHFQLVGKVEQSHLLFLFGDDFIEKREMVAEDQNGRRIVDFGVFADKCSKKMAAMGVTYSWLNRRSVTAKPVSPGSPPECPARPAH